MRVAKSVVSRLIFFSFFASASLWSGVAHGVPVGIISFNTFIPGPGGVNAFTIVNLTGPFALPPTFPVLNSLTFTGSALALVRGDGMSLPLISLGDIGPGPLSPLSLRFLDTTTFLSATFTAFLTMDGLPFEVSATFTPSPGAFAELDARAVPEPSTWILIVVGLAALLTLRIRQVAGRSTRSSAR